MDLEKFRRLFLEEATEHLREMSGALLALEKDPADREAIDLCFRMAHSIKGMAGSLDYASITELAHRFEDRMDAHRSGGRIPGPQAMSLLFRGLEGLEAMVETVRATGEAPPPAPELVAELEQDVVEEPGGESEKKAPRPPG